MTPYVFASLGQGGEGYSAVGNIYAQPGGKMGARSPGKTLGHEGNCLWSSSRFSNLDFHNCDSKTN